MAKAKTSTRPLGMNCDPESFREALQKEHGLGAQKEPELNKANEEQKASEQDPVKVEQKTAEREETKEAKAVEETPKATKPKKSNEAKKSAPESTKKAAPKETEEQQDEGVLANLKAPGQRGRAKTYYLSRELVQKVNVVAKQRGISGSALVEHILTETLKDL